MVGYATFYIAWCPYRVLILDVDSPKSSDQRSRVGQDFRGKPYLGMLPSVLAYPLGLQGFGAKPSTR